MASVGLYRQKHLLTVGIARVLEAGYVSLPLPGPVLQMSVTNLRNRPVTADMVSTLFHSVLSLYHNLITCARDFPSISFRGYYSLALFRSPFPHHDLTENAGPSLLSVGPPGLMVPPAGSSSCPPTILTPRLPETATFSDLRADRRNHVCRILFPDFTIIRVISPVYRTDATELPNRWIVSDYSEDGNILMSVLCRFIGKAARYAQRIQGKRKMMEEDSRQSPPQKRLRV